MISNVTRWLLVAVLLAVSIWTANLTVAYWWAAGGPPTPNPEQYEMRGNAFAVATLVLLGVVFNVVSAGDVERATEKQCAAKIEEVVPTLEVFAACS